MAEQVKAVKKTYVQLKRAALAYYAVSQEISAKLLQHKRLTTQDIENIAAAERALEFQLSIEE